MEEWKEIKGFEMDKLSEHAIRMLEIADANDISVIGNKQFRDIAKAIYDTILQVHVLKTALLHKTENSSEKPNNCKDEPQPRCPKCGKRGYIRSLESMGVKLKAFDEYRWKCTNCNKYFKEEPKDEPTISKMEQVEDEPRAEGVWNAGYKTGYDKGYKDAQKVKDSQDLVKAFCEDGTWLERQGVYTLTLAEAKQRAVDIIESVLAKDEPITKTETQNSNLTFEKDECAKEYEELGLKELKELIEADRKTEHTEREGK